MKRFTSSDKGNANSHIIDSESLSVAVFSSTFPAEFGCLCRRHKSEFKTISSRQSKVIMATEQEQEMNNSKSIEQKGSTEKNGMCVDGKCINI
jgi:hypothetical protein